MAITLTETVGSANANTYATSAECDTYATAHIDGSFWTALTTEPKAQHLIRAGREIDAQLLKGVKVATTQAMAFPRSNQGGIDDRAASTAIPAKVKSAQMEQAIALAQFGTNRRDELRASKVKSVSMGRHVSETFNSGGLVSLSSMAKSLLSPFLRTSGLVS